VRSDGLGSESKVCEVVWLNKDVFSLVMGFYWFGARSQETEHESGVQQPTLPEKRQNTRT